MHYPQDKEKKKETDKTKDKKDKKDKKKDKDKKKETKGEKEGAEEVEDKKLKRRRKKIDEYESSEEEEEETMERLKVEGKELLSITVPNPEMPTGIQELHEETLKEFIREDMNMYKTKWPTLIDLSDPQFKLNKIDALNNIRPSAIIEINLNECQMSHVKPDDFELFEKLKRLRMRRNHMRSFDIAVTCLKLEFLDLSYNSLNTMPKLQPLEKLKFLDISNNAIKDGFENILGLTKLRYIYANTNRLDWDQEEFNDTLLKMKTNSKTIVALRLHDNPFHGVVNAYKEWVFSNLRNLKHLDGVDYEKEEKKDIKYLPQPPSSEESTASEADLDKQYVGKKAKVRLWKMQKKLQGCQDKPNDVLIALHDVQTSLLEHVGVAARGRVLFDGKIMAEEQTRSLKLLDILVDNGDNGAATFEDELDNRDPAMIIEEFLMTVDMMMVRQPAIASKAMSLICMALNIENEDFYIYARKKLEEYLQAGELYAGMVVENMRKHVFDNLRRQTTSVESKRLLLESLMSLSDHEPVLEALRNMSTIILGWLSEPDPSRELLGVGAIVTKDLKIAIELNKQHVSKRIIELLARQSRDPAKRKAMMHMVGNLSHHIPQFAGEMVRAMVHIELLDELDIMLKNSHKWRGDDPEIQEVADIITAINGICRNSEVAVLDAQSRDYIDKIVVFLKQPEKNHPALLMNVLRAMAAILTVSTDLSVYKEDMNMVVSLLAYIDGDGYDRMCRQCDAVDPDGEPIKKFALRHKIIKGTLVEIVRFFTVFHRKARGDPDSEETAIAKDICDRLDKAEREEKLFSMLEIPDDEVKIEVIECLKVVPLDNFQPPEVEFLVEMVSKVENLSIGRIESVISGVLDIFTQLCVDNSIVGEWFRRVHTDSVHIVLNILTRNTARETVLGNRFEAEEQQHLSDTCINFLRKASEGMRWQEALDIMTSRVSVIAMGEVLKSEETKNVSGKPVLIEKSGCGRSVQSLLVALPELDMQGPVAKRVLLRLAEVLEGVEVSDNVSNMVKEEELVTGTFKPVDKAAEEWRLSQHQLFVQIDGLDIMLRYLLDNCPVNEELYTAKNVHQNYVSVKNEETRHREDIMLGEQILDNPPPIVERHATFYLLENNKELHKAECVMTAELFPMVGEADNRASEDDVKDNASAVAASLRVFQSLLMYGSPSTKAKAVAKGRNVDFVRTVVALADQITAGKWFPNGVGSNLLSIFTDLMLLHQTTDMELETVIPIYDVAGQVFYKMLSQLDPQVRLILKQRGRGRREALRLGHQAEDMYQKLAKAMVTMCSSLQYIRGAKDDLDVVEAAQDDMLTSVIEGDMVKCMVHYMFYDQIVESQLWDTGLDEQRLERQKTRDLLFEFVSEYLNVNDEMRFDVLQVFNRLEVSHQLSLRQSFLRDLLYHVSEKTYLHNLERWNLEKMIVPSFERILFSKWMDCDMFLPRLKDEKLQPLLDKTYKKLGVVRPLRLRQPSMKRLLFAISTTCMYIYRPQAGKPCSACDEFEFCPSGPRLMDRVNFEDIKGLQCSEEGLRARIVYQPNRVDHHHEKITRVVALTTMQTGLLRDMCLLLFKMIPQLTVLDAISVKRDPYLNKNLKGQMLIEREKAKVTSKKKGPAEQYIGTVGCFRDFVVEEGADKGKVWREERFIIVSSQRFYVLQERKDMWIAEQMDSIRREERNQKMVELEKERKLAKERGETEQKSGAEAIAEKKRMVQEKREEERLARERPDYVIRELDFSWLEMEEIMYGYQEDPTMILTFNSEDYELIFNDDKGRETCRRLLMQALKLKTFRRKFVVSGFKTSEAEPPGSIPV